MCSATLIHHSAQFLLGRFLKLAILLFYLIIHICTDNFFNPLRNPKCFVFVLISRESWGKWKVNDKKKITLYNTNCWYLQCANSCKFWVSCTTYTCLKELAQATILVVILKPVFHLFIWKTSGLKRIGLIVVMYC